MGISVYTLLDVLGILVCYISLLKNGDINFAAVMLIVHGKFNVRKCAFYIQKAFFKMVAFTIFVQVAIEPRHCLLNIYGLLRSVG